jgi:RNA polymerase sigma factor (TIGR02999 family)
VDAASVLFAAAFTGASFPALLWSVQSGEFTQLLQRVDQGDVHAATEILPLVYEELRKLAAAKMAREPGGLTLQPTALVHEAWLRLAGEQRSSWQSRAQFFFAAAEAMRRILIDNARRRQAIRHGGGLEKLSLAAEGIDLAEPEMPDGELLLLNEALENLARLEPRQAELIKHWYFAGMTWREAAEVMGVSLRTAERDWAFARAWLVTEMDRLRR